MRVGRFVLFLPALSVGCFSSSNGTPGSASDATADVDFSDTSVPEEAAMDSSIPMEASVDAPADVAREAAPEAEAGGVRVVVSSVAGAEPGVQVIVQDATGNVISTGTTDAAGAFSQSPIASGSQVTVLLGSPTAASILTIEGVEPGDTLPVFDATLPPSATGAVTVDSVPANPPTGTASYRATAGGCNLGFVPGPTTLQTSGLRQCVS